MLASPPPAPPPQLWFIWSDTVRHTHTHTQTFQPHDWELSPNATVVLTLSVQDPRRRARSTMWPEQMAWGHVIPSFSSTDTLCFPHESQHEALQVSRVHAPTPSRPGLHPALHSGHTASPFGVLLLLTWGSHLPVLLIPTAPLWTPPGHQLLLCDSGGLDFCPGPSLTHLLL